MNGGRDGEAVIATTGAPGASVRVVGRLTEAGRNEELTIVYGVAGGARIPQRVTTGPERFVQGAGLFRRLWAQQALIELERSFAWWRDGKRRIRR